jgi:arylsulfatase A-like enzyme
LGFHQGHTWADWNDPNDDKAMRTQDPTIGKILSKAGYRTGMYGKWGYGATRDLENPKIVNLQTLPINHGYHDCVVELHHVRAHTFLQPTLWYSHVNADGNITMDTSLLDNRKMFPKEDLYADNYYTAGAIKFIREEANGPSPFFLQLSFQIPHGPFDEIDTLPGWFDDYKDVDTSKWEHNIKQYAANMTLMDKLIGRVMAALRDPNNDGDESDSIMDNTLIIFSSDNGGGGYKELRFFNGNGHLRDYKGTVAEGGIRDPLAFYWEGVIEPGQTTDYKTCVTDIFPTFCELAGTQPPVGIDGVSIVPAILGKGVGRQRPYFCYEAPGGKSWIWSVVRGDMKLGKEANGKLHLYNLKTDESETNNLADDPAYADLIFELLQIAQDENLEADNLYANVWPTWVGKNGANVNDPGSWMETGTWEFDNKWPQSETPAENWNAVVVNRFKRKQKAFLDTSIETLGFEVCGNPDSGAIMELELKWNTTLVGRNEIRIAPHSIVKIDGGILESVRWVDIQKDATLEGCGSVNATLYNAGKLDIAAASVASKRKRGGGLTVAGDFDQSKTGTLAIAVGRMSPLVVKGKADIAGQLKLTIPKDFKARNGQRFPVLRASSVSGEFGTGQKTIVSGEHKFRIHYSTTMVELEKI